MRILARIAALCAVLATLLAVPTAATGEPAMWHVQSATTDITLFGTVHALPPGTEWLSPRITARLDAADTLVLETVLPDDPAGLGPLVTALGLKAGLPPVAARVAPSKRAALLAGVSALGLSARQLDGMKTWLAAIAIGDGAVEQLGFTQGGGVEAALTARARAANKPVIGLETPEAQLRIFDRLPETDARALLDSTVDDLATVRDDTNALVAYWQAGETDALAADFDKDFRTTPVLARALLSDRNAAWAEWIAARLAVPGKVFLAVGAGHLGGPGSVVALLRAKGLTVERLP
jgi:uncharacterized protein YbaP (TraB family)